MLVVSVVVVVSVVKVLGGNWKGEGEGEASKVNEKGLEKGDVVGVVVVVVVGVVGVVGELSNQESEKGAASDDRLSVGVVGVESFDSFSFSFVCCLRRTTRRVGAVLTNLSGIFDSSKKGISPGMMTDCIRKGLSLIGSCTCDSQCFFLSLIEI